MLKIIAATTLTAKLKADIFELYPLVFESFNTEKFNSKFEYHSRFLLLMAYENDKAVGFKFGYGQDEGLFYSWTGGVHPAHRQQGIAEALMRHQHDWCRKQNYKIIETRTRNKFPQMINLNLKHGFQIVGTFIDTDQEPKIILRKSLANLIVGLKLEC